PAFANHRSANRFGTSHCRARFLAVSNRRGNPMHSAKVYVLAGIAIMATAIANSARSLPVRMDLANWREGSAPDKKKVTVPAGTRILIRTTDPIDTEKQKAGYRFTASLETNLQADDEVVAPRGSVVYGRLAEASSAGRMSGSSQLTLELTDIVING